MSIKFISRWYEYEQKSLRSSDGFIYYLLFELIESAIQESLLGILSKRNPTLRVEPPEES